LTLTKKVTAPQLESTGIINMKGDYTEIRANSNVVTEFQRSKKLIKYPRVALTQNALNNGYTVIQSGINDNEHRKAWTLFNNDVTTSDQYHAVPQSGESNPYNPSTGAYEPDAGFEDGLGDVAGEYVYVVMPDKIKLQGVSVHPRDIALARSAESARFMGSNDETNWVDLGGYTDYVWASGSQEPGNFFTVDSDGYYNYIGVVWTKVKGGSGGDTVNMTEVQFYGVPEYDPEADGTDVVVKSVPNVPNTDWLEVYYDAKDLEDGALSTASGAITGLGGTTINGTAFGDPQVSNGAFVFDGTGDYIETSSVLPSTFIDDVQHSIGMWFKVNTINLEQTLMMIHNGGNDTNQSPHIVISTAGILRYDFYSNDIKLLDPIVLNQWYHLTITFSGGNHASGTKIYINGVHNTNVSTPSSTDTLDIQASSFVTLGSRANAGQAVRGSIANFRLFNRALTSDEVWQLYAYQKEYFGHGDLGMTLKAGRLGIGTSEPRAALDVRGDIMGGCPAAFSVAYNPTSLSGNQTIIWNLVYYNVGGGYNSSDGLFTAPVSGYYHFTVWGMTSGTASGTIEFQFMKNGSTVQQRPYGHAGGNYGNATGSIIEYLSVGNTMSIFLTDSTTMYAGSVHSYNGFSGFYLSS